MSKQASHPNGANKLSILLFVLAAIVALSIAAWLVLKPTDSDPNNAEVTATDFDPWTPRSTEGFVGSQACRECHEEIVDRYASHPMFNAARELSDSDIAKVSGKFSSGPGIEYEVVTANGESKHIERAVDKNGETIYEQSVDIDFILGSGARGQSFVHQRDGLLFVSPVSWYSEEQKWDIAPGYEHRSNPRFDRPITDRCLVCHSGRLNYAQPPKYTHVAYAKPIFLEYGIGCERCHGPGQDHIAHHRGDRANDSMVNITTLSPAKRDAVCNQCHLLGEQQFLRTGRQNTDFRPGDHLGDIWTLLVKRQDPNTDVQAVSHARQMNSSRCFIESQGKLGCITCHDPHFRPPVEDRAAFSDKSCAKCHQVDDCDEQESTRLAAPAKGSCTHCHMPRLPTSDIPHSSQTDHRILRRIDSPPNKTDETATAKSSEPGPLGELTIFEEELVPLPKLAKQRVVGLWLAMEAIQTGNESQAAQAEALLTPIAEASANDPVVLDSLGMTIFIQSRMEDAIAVWTRIMDNTPDHSSALFSLAQTSEAVGDAEGAEKHWNHLIQVQPWKAHWRFRKARLLENLGGRTQEAAEAGLKAIELDPNYFKAYPLTISMLRRLGRFDEAKQLEMNARRLTETLPPPKNSGTDPPPKADKQP